MYLWALVSTVEGKSAELRLLVCPLPLVGPGYLVYSLCSVGPCEFVCCVWLFERATRQCTREGGRSAGIGCVPL